MDAPEREREAIRSFLHPAAGAFILGLDWLLFGGTAATGGAGLALSVVLGFLIGGLGTGLIQRIVAKDRAGAALLKGLIAGIVVGLPFPIGGRSWAAVLASSAGPVEAAIGARWRRERPARRRRRQRAVNAATRPARAEDVAALPH